MKKAALLIVILMITICGVKAEANQTVFKPKKYYGPIPYNSVSLNFGFLDGADASNFTDYITYWTVTKRSGKLTWNPFKASPYLRVGYTGRIAPQYFIRASASFSYLKASASGDYIAQLDSLIPLDTKREFKVFLFSAELGFTYHFIKPEAKEFSPYFGVGMAALFPYAKFETDNWYQKVPFSAPGDNESKFSMEAGFHSEFGLEYYLTNRFSFTLEIRYQMGQSKFRYDQANFDIDYSGFTLSLGSCHYF